MSSELEDYRQQLAEVDRLLSESVDAEERRSLEETRADLCELISLLEEQQGESSSQETTSEDAGEAADTSNEVADDDFEDLVGSRCIAPFHRAKLPLEAHNAIILDVSGRGEVTVLYNNPMLDSMRPCSYFLAGTCRFVDSCRFSHGETFAMDDLHEYEAPDFENVKEGSVVLVSVENGLWDAGRVTAKDGTKLAVRIFKTGKEIETSLESVCPVDAEETEEQSPPVNLSQNSFPELKGERLGNVSVGELGDWEGGGFGLKLMQKMGYRLGEGLGKRGNGIVHAIQATILPKKQGVGYEDGRKRKRVVDGKEKARGRLKKEAAIRHINAIEDDIFAFLNRRFASSEADEEKRLKEEHSVLKKESDRELGSRVISLDNQLKDLQKQEKKFLDGIQRNKNDRPTRERLEKSLRAVRAEIEKMAGRRGQVSREFDSRRQNKKNFF